LLLAAWGSPPDGVAASRCGRGRSGTVHAAGVGLAVPTGRGTPTRVARFALRRALGPGRPRVTG